MYSTVKNIRELKVNYEIIHMLESGEAFQNKANAKEWLDSIKRANRKFTHEESDERVIKDYGIDGYIILKSCPDWVETEEDAEEWFDSEEKMVYIPSPYDCTGQQFTSWYKLFQRNGKWMCYHSIGVDV